MHAQLFPEIANVDTTPTSMPAGIPDTAAYGSCNCISSFETSFLALSTTLNRVPVLTKVVLSTTGRLSLAIGELSGWRFLLDEM
jgi:hypothetical protein